MASQHFLHGLQKSVAKPSRKICIGMERMLPYGCSDVTYRGKVTHLQGVNDVGTGRRTVSCEKAADVSKVGSVRCVPISKIPRQLIQFPFLMTSTPKTKESLSSTGSDSLSLGCLSWCRLLEESLERCSILSE